MRWLARTLFMYRKILKTLWLAGSQGTQTDNIETVLAVEITKTGWRVGTGNSHYYTLGSPNFFICPQCIPVSTLSTEGDNHRGRILPAV